MPAPRVSRHEAVDFTCEIRATGGNAPGRSELPIGHVHGASSDILPRVQQALAGSAEGDSTALRPSPEQGFGPSRPAPASTDAIASGPTEYRRTGAEAMFPDEKGERLAMAVTRIAGGRVTLDGNHPCAGELLDFRLAVSAIRDATPEEPARGAPVGGARFTH